MIVARQPSQSPAARELAAWKRQAQERAVVLYGPEAKVVGYFQGEFFAECPTDNPRRFRVLPVTGMELQ